MKVRLKCDANCEWTPDAFAVATVDDIRLMDTTRKCEGAATYRAMHPIINGWAMVCDSCGPLMSKVRGDVSRLGFMAECRLVDEQFETEQDEARTSMTEAINTYAEEHPEIELKSLVTQLGAQRSDVTATLKTMGFAVRQIKPENVNRWVRPHYLTPKKDGSNDA